MTENAKKKRGLGRGLGSLISAAPVAVELPTTQVKEAGKSDNVVSMPERAIVNISTNKIEENAKSAINDNLVKFVQTSQLSANPDQPRKNFSSAEVSELASSIRELGVLQPILVRQLESGSFQIIAGERRFRAAKEAGLLQVPVIIKDYDDRQALEVGLVENVQRTDLSPLEEARGYDELMNRFNLSQLEVSEKVGKDRTTIANSVRLLKLPIEVQAFLESGAITVGHAKSILSVKEPKLQVALAHKVLKDRLSVRELERIVGRKVDFANNANRKKNRMEQSSGDSLQRNVHSTSNISEELQRVLGTKVRILEQPTGRGKIVIEYFSKEELERVYDIVCK
jgi:ParB family chromosome partitioning protein